MEARSASPLGSPVISDYHSSSDSEDPEFAAVSPLLDERVSESTRAALGTVVEEMEECSDMASQLKVLEGRIKELESRNSKLENLIDIRCLEDASQTIAVGDVRSDDPEYAPFWRAALKEFLYAFGVEGFGHLVNWMKENDVETLSVEAICRYSKDLKIQQGRQSIANLGDKPHPRFALLKETRALGETEMPRQLSDDSSEAVQLNRGAVLDLLNFDCDERSLTIFEQQLFVQVGKDSESTLTVRNLVGLLPTARHHMVKRIAKAEGHLSSGRPTIGSLFGMPPLGGRSPMGLGGELGAMLLQDALLRALLSDD